MDRQVETIRQKKSYSEKERGRTWKMAYMMHVRGRLLEYSDTVKIFRPHLFRSSSSCRWKMPTDSGKTSQTQACPHGPFLQLVWWHYLGQQLFLVGFHTKAGDAAVEAGPVRHLLHAADLSHQLLLLLLFLLPGLWCGWWNLNLILFVWREESEQHRTR